MEDPDRDLIEAVAALDESACAELIRRAEGLIQGALGYRWFDSQADRDEVVQDIRLELIKSANKWDPSRARFSTWVYGVARNIYNSYLRRRKRRPSEVPFTDMGDEFDPPVLETEPGDQTGPSDHVRAFWRVYEQMSHDDRTVVDHMVRHADGVGGHAELAATLGVSNEAAKQRVYRMKARLKKAIEVELRSARDLAANKQREQ